jgi:hypothetical protein
VYAITELTYAVAGDAEFAVVTVLAILRAPYEKALLSTLSRTAIVSPVTPVKP